jgi:hypothetical protein
LDLFDGYTVCPHQFTGESLQNSAIDGCHICSVVWSHLAYCQHKYLLELEAADSITQMFISSSETSSDTDARRLFDVDTLTVGVHFHGFVVDGGLWDVPGGARRQSYQFLLQPSEGNELFFGLSYLKLAASIQ